MAASLPYTHYACPCADLTAASTPPPPQPPPPPPPSKRASAVPPPPPVLPQHDRTFNPHDPRANYALYPLDRLLYCDECDAVRCPRCWTEEILYWYCPHCLFEVPSSAVRGDGNRCSRNCYNCPSCTAQLAVAAIAPPKDEAFLRPDDALPHETYILQCECCHWSSLDIAVQFTRPTKITEQLAKLRKARFSSTPAKAAREGDCRARRGGDHDEAFANLQAFYKEQLNESGDPQNPYSSSPYGSPANLARIMSLYGGLSYNALKKTREKPQPMREAATSAEGAAFYTADSGGGDTVDKLESVGWEGTSSGDQRLSAPVNNDAAFVDQLWPVATLLRTGRGKRCRTCRQFLARLEPKVGSMRYRIRLLALNHIPRLSIRPLQPSNPGGTATNNNPSFHLRAGMPEEPPLKPSETKHYILTVRNPIFEPVKITLATPATTPGPVASKVTILCPSFTLGPAGDVWDEALSNSQPPPPTDGGRRAAMASLTGSNPAASDAISATADRQPEAGKIWDRTRNSTSVILEIVPGSRRRHSRPSATYEGGNDADDDDDDDDNILEIPVYVRAEWQVEMKPGEPSSSTPILPAGGGGGGGGDRDVTTAATTATRGPADKVDKELGYWTVLGVGRIGRG